MSLTRILGRGLYYPNWIPATLVPALSTTGLIDATGEMNAFCGRITWFDTAKTGTRNISRVQFRFGAVTKAGGSVLTASLQDIDNATGPPMQPDGGQDQTYTIANADANFASNTWYRTGTLSTSRTVSYGDKLAFVVEYDGAGRLGADSVIINGWGSTANYSNLESLHVLKTGGTYAALTGSTPNVIFEFDDGGFGCFDYGVGIQTLNTLAFNSGSAADEAALAFQMPVPCAVDGAWVSTFPSGTAANFDVVLYDGTTPLATTSVDANAVLTNAAGRPLFVPLAEQTLTANHTYYLAIKPTTANNVTVYSMDVSNANFWTAMDAGINFNYSTRVDAGSWAAVTTTRRLVAGIRISQLDDGGGSRSPFSSPVIKAA